MAIQESKLIISLVDRASAPARAIGATLRQLNEAQARTNAALGAARGQMLDAVGAGFALAQAIGQPVRAFAEFETTLEDIAQKINKPREDLPKLGAAIRKVAADTNNFSKDIASGFDILAGMGASEGDALGMLPDIGKAAVAYRAEIADLSKAGYAALDNLKVPANQFGRALDAMAQAGKAGAFELKDMASYFPTLGAAYQGLKQTGVPAVADLAAALQIVRKGTGDASSAATNLGNVIQKIYAPGTIDAFRKKGVDLRKEMEKAGKAGKSPIEAIAEITNRVLKGDLSKLGDLFQDSQVQAGLRPLIQNIEEYRKIRAEALKAQGVVEEDYQKRLQTGALAGKRFAVAMESISLAIGAALLPALTDLANLIVPVLNRMADFAAANPRLTAAIIGTVGGFVALRIAAIGLKYSMLWMKSGLLATAITGVRSLGAATAAASVPFVALGRGLGIVAPSARGAAKASVASAQAMMSQKQAALQAALAVQDLARKGAVAGTNVAQANAAVRASGRALAQAQGEMKRSSAALAALGPSAFSAAGAFRAVGAAIRFAFISTGVGAIIAAIAAAGYWIYQNWDGIGAMFEAFGQSFMKALGPAGPAVEKFAGWVSTIWEKVKDLLGPLDETGTKWREWGTTLGEVVGGGVKSLIDGLEKVAGWLKDLIKLAQDAGAAISNFFGAEWKGGPAMPPPAPDGTPRKRAGSFARAAVFAPPAAIPLPEAMPVSPGIDLQPLPSFGADAARQAASDLEGALAGGSGDISRAGGDVADAIMRAAADLRRAGEDAARAISSARITAPTFAAPPRANANLGQSMPTVGTPGG